MAETADQSATRWLDDEEQATWRAFVVASQLLMDQLDRELQRDAGMPLAYYGILAMLSEQPERAVRMTDLARILRYSKSRLSEAAVRLEARGWIRRESCPTDRRGAVAVLTNEGFAALRAAAPTHVEGVFRHLFNRLTAEQLLQLREISLAVAAPLLEEAGFDPQHC